MLTNLTPKLINRGWPHLSSTQGGPAVVKWVNPTGDTTPARPGTVAAVGNTLQGTGEAVLALIGEPLLPRVERCGCWVVGRPELTTAEPPPPLGR